MDRLRDLPSSSNPMNKTMQGKINITQTTTNTGSLKSINMVRTNQSVFSAVKYWAWNHRIWYDWQLRCLISNLKQKRRSTTDATYVVHMSTSDSTGCRLHIRKELDAGFNYKSFSTSSLAFCHESTDTNVILEHVKVTFLEAKKKYGVEKFSLN